MGIAVKKRISLPSKLAKEVEDISREKGKSLSAVIQDALRLARKEIIKKEFFQIQDYWSRKAKEKGILTEKDLERYLKTYIINSLRKYLELWKIVSSVVNLTLLYTECLDCHSCGSRNPD